MTRDTAVKTEAESVDVAEWHRERAAEYQEGVDAYPEGCAKWRLAVDKRDFHTQAASLIAAQAGERDVYRKALLIAIGLAEQIESGGVTPHGGARLIADNSRAALAPLPASGGGVS